MLVKVPFTNTKGAYYETISDGTIKAPDKILEIFKEIWMDESYKKSIDFLELEKQIKEIHFQEKIFEEAKKIFEKGKKVKQKVIFLGGDHSITYSLARAFKEIYSHNYGLLVFDAHLDCMPCHKIPNHEEWLRALIERENFTKIIHVGLRAPCLEEINFAKEKKLPLFSCKELFKNFKRNAEKIIKNLKKFENLYVSIDLDVVDPAFAPGVSCPEPCGLTSREFLYLIQKLSKLDNLKAVDLVCVNPEKDLNNMTIKLAAKIIAELL